MSQAIYRCFLSLSIVLLFAARLAYSQAPAFEVASVKTNDSGSRSSSSRTLPGGRFVATNTTVRQLLLSAYHLRPFQLVGGPNWIDSDRFDIEARAPENGPPDQLMMMLGTLLADRFKAVVHSETKEQPVYALMLARSDGAPGPKLKASNLDCSSQEARQTNGCGMNTSTNRDGGLMKAGARSMSDLATSLGSFVAGRMVVDRTGLTGIFDFELRWAPDNLQTTSTDATTPAADAPSIFIALCEQLGLKLEAERGPVEFLIVDKIEHPTAN